MRVVDGWVVGDAEVEEIGVADVGERVGLAGRVKDGVAGGEKLRFVAGADFSGAAEEEEEFPLRGVRVERAGRFAGCEFAEFDVERMSAEAGGRIVLGAERERELFARAAEFAFGRMPACPGEIVDVAFA